MVKGWTPSFALLFGAAIAAGGCAPKKPSNAQTGSIPPTPSSVACDGCSPAARAFLQGIAATPSPGKHPAKPVKSDEGLVIGVTAEQLEMLGDTSTEFSPTARLARGVEACTAEIVALPAPQNVSNIEQLQGGRLEPDPFLVAVETESKITASPYPVSAEMSAKIEAIFKNEAADKVTPEECKTIEETIALDPAMPMLHFLAAGCWQKAGDAEKSIALLEEELAVNPTHHASYLAVADVLFDKGLEGPGMEDVALALLYYPAWEMPGKYLAARKAPCKVRSVGFAPPVLVAVGPGGVVVAAHAEDRPWLESYASCKAALRYCPEARMSFGLKAQPYKVSLLEELVCLTVAGDRYRELKGGAGGKDPDGDRLLEALEEDRLVPFALFEIIGTANPDYMKFLPNEVREGILDYIRAFVIAGEDDGPCPLWKGVAQK
jgi:hypothetical protein